MGDSAGPAGGSLPSCRRTDRRGPGWWLPLALWLALPAVQTTPSAASPALLDRRLRQFSSSAASEGLRFCAIFLPLDASGRSEQGGKAESTKEVRFGGGIPLVPASLAKLVTSTMALERLGSGYRFRTRIFADGSLADSVLHGDLVVSGGGDPFLVSERLWLLAGQLRETGLRQVTGSLVIDPSAFAADSSDPSRCRDREISDRAYAARLSPLAVNFNAAAFHLTAGEEPGAPPRIDPDPLSCSYIRIENLLRSSPAGMAEDYTVRLIPDSLGEIARFEGSLPALAEARTVYRSVDDPGRFSGSMLCAFLLQAGIRIDGGVRIEPRGYGREPMPPVEAGGMEAESSRVDARREAPRTPSSAGRLLLEFPSPPLSELIGRANRYSNNFMADLIAMALSDSGDTPLSLTSGAARITRWLHEDLDAGSDVRMVDGSGLNPADRLSGDVLARVLVRAWHDLRITPDLLASLPVPGSDGTLHHRFEESAPVLRAKTGTMGDPMASGIAGYLQDPGGTRIAFVILMNARPAAPASRPGLPGKSPTDGTAGWDIPRLQALQEDWVREYLRAE